MKLKKLEFESYLKIIKNSVGANVWRNYYVLEGNKKIDVYNDGQYSCAFFVSSILALFKLIDAPHAIVKTTKKALTKKGWRTRNNLKPKPGDILIWELIDHNDNDFHEHIGFYLGNKKAISNHPTKRVPVSHNYERDNITNKKRAITAIYYWPKFQ